MDQRAELLGRTGIELLADQLEGLASWHRDRARRLLAAEASQTTREQRLDARHRLDATRRAHSALLARADLSIEESRELLGEAPIRSLLANRSEWMRHKLALGLEELGLTVVAHVADGADALGVAVIEQPDVLILEDRLPSMTGIEVVQALRVLSPKTWIAAQVEDPSSVPAMREAGAAAVFSRRIPPQVVVRQVAEQLGALRPGDMTVA